METLISYLNNIGIDNTFITTVQNSKDIFLGFIAAIFAIFIPLVIHYYSTLEKSEFPHLDSKIFTTKYFNIFHILKVLFFMLLGIFLLTINEIFFFTLGFVLFIGSAIFSIKLLINLYNYLSKKYSGKKLFIEKQNFLEKNKNFNNEIILEFLQNNTGKEPIFYLEFFYNKLLKYEINFLNAHSKLIIESLLKKIENEDNFHTKKIGEFFKKIELTDLFGDTLNKEHIFEDYKFTTDFFKIFFTKIDGRIKKQKQGDLETEQLIRSLLFSYKKLEENSHILNSFNYQDFKLLLKIYKTDNENNNSYLSCDIMSVIVLMVEKNSGDTYWFLHHLQNFLEKENDNFRFKFLSHFHSSIFNSKIILEDSEFMEHYGKEIFNKYNSISGKLQNGIFQKLINLLWKKEGDYNYGYDNVLGYWLLDFEPILFTELLYLYFIGYGENKALSILEAKRAFGGIGRLMTLGPGEKTFEEQERKLHKNTIENFYETFKNNVPNFDELISQFQKLEKNEKLSERDILKSKSYINLLRKLKEITKKHEK